MKKLAFLSRPFSLLCLFLGLVIFTLPCTASASYAPQDLSSLQIPDNVKIVGLGEATHGNSEFMQLKKDVLKLLVEKKGYRIFALEADFGSCLKVNDYVVNGNGTLDQAVFNTGFSIYQCEEIKELIKWMRTYNMDKAHVEKLKFYGFDMQQYDSSKALLMGYLKKVDKSMYSTFSNKLKAFTDMNVSSLDSDQFDEGLLDINELLYQLSKKKVDMIKTSSQLDYDIANQCASNIKKAITLDLSKGSYVDTRDLYMAKNIMWILQHESKQGFEKLMIAGHNGHIDKSAAMPAALKNMGYHLAKNLKDDYYTIGTESYENSFMCRNSSTNKREVFKLRKNKSSLLTPFLPLEKDISLIDLPSAMKDQKLKPLFITPQTMTCIGESFSPYHQYIPMFYQVKYVPVKAFDALILVKKATPSKMLK